MGSQLRHLPALAIFARAPSPGKAKTRLIPFLGARGAAEFQAALISDALRKADRLAGRAARYFFLAGRNPLSRPDSYTLIRQRGADLGERLENAFRRLLSGHPGVVVIGTDSPTLPPRLLREAIRELRASDAVLGPCPDGGYYLIGLRRPRHGALDVIFRGVRWGSAFAFRDTLRNFLRRNFSCSVLEAWADVDRAQDVRRLRSELARSDRARRVAPATWRFLKGRPAGLEPRPRQRPDKR